MFNIKLYHFNKRTNSTKRPGNSDQGDLFPCYMRTQSSIINPIIEIQASGTALLTYNYAYISSFGGRYYFIDDIVYDQGIYVLYLSVDVLATYYSDIRASSQYVVRQDGKFNRNIIDNAYITIARPDRINSLHKDYMGIPNHPDGVNYFITGGGSGSINNYFNIGLSQGNYVLAIVGNNGTGVEHYCMDYTAFRQLLNQAFNLIPSDTPQDLANSVGTAICDPLSYIVSCK